MRRAGEYVYHLACFSCDICHRQLSTGEQFKISIVEDKNLVRLLCRLHFGLAQSTGFSSSQVRNLWQFSTDTSTSSSNHNQALHIDYSMYENNLTAEEHLQMIPTRRLGENPLDHELIRDGAQTPGSDFGSTGRPPSASGMVGASQMSHKLAQLGSPPGAGNNSNPTSTGSGSSSSNAANNLMTGSSKSKRVRTTFTEEQLSILQNQFQIDSNPDGQDLERIATITGLSKRVTQVWFQNSRARQKKYMIKRKPTQSSSGSPIAHAQHQNGPNQSQLRAFDGPAQGICMSNHIQNPEWPSSGPSNQDKPSNNNSWSAHLAMQSRYDGTSMCENGSDRDALEDKSNSGALTEDELISSGSEDGNGDGVLDDEEDS